MLVHLVWSMRFRDHASPASHNQTAGSTEAVFLQPVKLHTGCWLFSIAWVEVLVLVGDLW